MKKPRSTAKKSARALPVRTDSEATEPSPDVAAPPPAREFQGFFDSCGPSHVTGWVFDRASPGTPLEIEVRVDGTPVATATANLFRMDLLENGIGAGVCAFKVPLPEVLSDGLEHKVEVREVSTGFILPNSPISVTISTTGDGQQADHEAAHSSGRETVRPSHAPSSRKIIDVPAVKRTIKSRRESTSPEQARRAALTIVSKNYISAARVLAKSFLKHHPGASFFVFLVDEVEGRIDAESEPFHLIGFGDVPLSGATTFPYRYTILELNTAVKPFVLEYVFNTFPELDEVLYIDPDIEVFADLQGIWNGLADHDIVVTPHMRRPFNDGRLPTELNIVQSGTYNLGFIGLRRSAAAAELLTWWQERLHLECVVDIPRGLFTDQKWIDLVPAYFESVKILRDPAYNVAYWNLHERTLERIGEGQYLVNGEPLRFFHFSGYSPLNPNSLSKHQNRHELQYLPVVQQICAEYGQHLLDEGYEETIKLPYAFGKLSNGMEVGQAVIKCVREFLLRNIAFPDPTEEVDEFCRFLFTPSTYLHDSGLPPIVDTLLKLRPDVRDAFPNVHQDPSGVLQWLKTNGKDECRIPRLVDRYAALAERPHPSERILAAYSSRSDLQETFPQFWRARSGWNGFCNWVSTSGPVELGLTPRETKIFASAEGAFWRILLLYLMRPDLQEAFLRLHNPDVLKGFVRWLHQNINHLPNISYSDVCVFDFVAARESEYLLLVNFLYNQKVRAHCAGEPTLRNFKAALALLGSAGPGSEELVARLLSSGQLMSPLAQIKAAFCGESWYVRRFGQEQVHSVADLNELGDLYWHDAQAAPRPGSPWKKLLDDQAARKSHNGLPVINVAGNFSASTGMGQSARCMLQILDAAGIEIGTTELPSTFVAPEYSYRNFDDAKLLGWPDPQASVSITVANADTVFNAYKSLPKSYWSARRQIGYWVWETEALPRQFAKSCALFDEIWTPSEYSAAAIRTLANIPVHVLPHVVDFDEVNRAVSPARKRAYRRKFGLPADGLLYGYFFDAKSQLERKNPEALLRAFVEAFPGREDVFLVMKVSSPNRAAFEYQKLRGLYAMHRNILWVEDTMSRADVLRFMSCLDVYASLHRSEGFGLTMAEAMALGIPVIASGYSGNVDFMQDAKTALLVNTPVVTTQAAFGPYELGTRWGNPDHADAVAKLRLAADNAELRDRIGKAAHKYVRENLTAAALMPRVLSLLALRAGEAYKPNAALRGEKPGDGDGGKKPSEVARKTDPAATIPRPVRKHRSVPTPSSKGKNAKTAG